jgi:hypothetical protein
MVGHSCQKLVSFICTVTFTWLDIHGKDLMHLHLRLQVAWAPSSVPTPDGNVNAWQVVLNEEEEAPSRKRATSPAIALDAPSSSRQRII